jgi:hypothetical protein
MFKKDINECLISCIGTLEPLSNMVLSTSGKLYFRPRSYFSGFISFEYMIASLEYFKIYEDLPLGESLTNTGKVFINVTHVNNPPIVSVGGKSGLMSIDVISQKSVTVQILDDRFSDLSIVKESNNTYSIHIFDYDLGDEVLYISRVDNSFESLSIDAPMKDSLFISTSVSTFTSNDGRNHIFNGEWNKLEADTDVPFLSGKSLLRFDSSYVCKDLNTFKNNITTIIRDKNNAATFFNMEVIYQCEDLPTKIFFLSYTSAISVITGFIFPAIGLLVCMLHIFAIFYLRNTESLKTTSWRLNIASLMGAAIIYIFIVALNTDPRSLESCGNMDAINDIYMQGGSCSGVNSCCVDYGGYACSSSFLLLNMGMALFLGAQLLKAYRIRKIFLIARYIIYI